MAMGVIWTALVLSALVCRGGQRTAGRGDGGGAGGRRRGGRAGADHGGGAVFVVRRDGAAAARRTGGGFSRRLRPLLGRLLPGAARDRETMEAVSANVSANLLGLGNAATPAGIRAAKRLAQGCGGHGQRRSVPAGGAEHRVGAAAAHHGGLGAGGAGLRRAAGHPAGGVGCRPSCR